MNSHVYSSSSEPVQVLSGRELDREVRTATPTKRALLAADVEAGRLLVERPTARQARLITGSSPCYLYAARLLSPMERAAVRTGRASLAAKARERRQLTDSKLDQLVSQLGAERVMAALDRVTRPMAIAAE